MWAAYHDTTHVCLVVFASKSRLVLDSYLGIFAALMPLLGS